MAELDWNLIRSFVTVAETGSLSAAARRLDASQPTLGRHVSELEQALGVTLFRRGRRGYELTEAGAVLYERGRTVSDEAAAFSRLALGSVEAIEGTVRLAASDVVAAYVLPDIVARLGVEEPGIEIEIVASNQVENLLRRDADIAIRMVRPTQNELVARKVTDIALCLAATTTYLDRCGRPGSPSDLPSHRLIGFDRETAFIRAAMDALPMLSGLSFAFRSDNNLAQLAAIRAGMGIGLCQVPLGRREPDLVRLFAKEIDLPLETHVVMHEDMKSARRCRLVFDALVQGLKTFIAS